jgi:predicted metal-dependent phosphotriesterase family hydrolase
MLLKEVQKTVLGYYVNDAQTEDTLSLSVEAMSAFMKKEMVEGCHDDNSIKCGLVGEIGICWPMHGKVFLFF